MTCGPIIKPCYFLIAFIVAIHCCHTSCHLVICLSSFSKIVIMSWGHCHHLEFPATAYSETPGRSYSQINIHKVLGRTQVLFSWYSRYWAVPGKLPEEECPRRRYLSGRDCNPRIPEWDHGHFPIPKSQDWAALNPRISGLTKFIYLTVFLLLLKITLCIYSFFDAFLSPQWGGEGAAMLRVDKHVFVYQNPESLSLKE